MNVVIDGGGFVTTTLPTTTIPAAPGITLAPASGLNPVGTNHTVTATVRNDSSQVQPGVTVTFTILSGPNQGETGTGVTDASGQATFTCSEKADQDRTRSKPPSSTAGGRPGR